MIHILTHSRLRNGIHVAEKVDASGAILLDGTIRPIFIGGKCDASGAISIIGDVHIIGDLKSSGRISLKSVAGKEANVVVEGRVASNGAFMIEGDVVVP